MGSPIAGNPANFPATFLIPDDADPKNASSVNIAFEALADRTANAKGRLDSLANQIVRHATWTNGPPFPVSFNDTPGPIGLGADLFTLKTGDIVFSDACFYARRSNATVNAIKVELQLYNDTTAAVAASLGETELFGSGSLSFESVLAITSVAVIPTDGDYHVRLASKDPITPGAGTTFELKNSGAAVRVLVYRPTP